MTMTASQMELDGIDGAIESDAPVARHVPRLSVMLHWLTAALVLAMFCMGVLMKQLGEGAFADALYTTHKVTGVALLGLILVRIGYRALAQTSGRWRRGAASRPIHGLLYLVLVLVPLLGWAGVSDYGARAVFLGLSLPAIWPEGAGHADLLFAGHAWLACALMAFVVVHIGIALNDFIQRGAQRVGSAARQEKDFP